MGKRRLRRLMQILGVLAHADGAGWDWEIGRLWGAAPRPGRGGAANAAPENGEQSARQAGDGWGALGKAKLPSL